MIIKSKIDRVVELYNTFTTTHEVKVREVSKCEEELQGLANNLELLEQCTSIFRSVAEVRREALKYRLEKLLSHGLQLVFEESLTVLVEYKKWGASDRVQIYVKDNHVTAEIQKYRGGSLTQVVSFLIRILILVLYKPSQRRLFIGDEIFSAVSAQHLSSLSRLLQELAGKLKVQIILVTHSQELMEHADMTYEASKVDGATILRRA